MAVGWAQQKTKNEVNADFENVRFSNSALKNTNLRLSYYWSVLAASYKGAHAEAMLFSGALNKF